MDLLASRPDLQDLFLDPESESGGSEALPHPSGPLGKELTAAALLLTEEALRVAGSFCKMLQLVL